MKCITHTYSAQVTQPSSPNFQGNMGWQMLFVLWLTPSSFQLNFPELFTHICFSVEGRKTELFMRYVASGHHMLQLTQNPFLRVSLCLSFIFTLFPHFSMDLLHDLQDQSAPAQLLHGQLFYQKRCPCMIFSPEPTVPERNLLQNGAGTRLEPGL